MRLRLKMRTQDSIDAVAEGAASLIEKAIASKEKRFVLFEGAGHESGQQADQALWEAEVGAFLRSISSE